MSRKKKLKPYALEKPGQQLAPVSHVSFEETEGSLTVTQIKRQRKEQQELRKAQKKQARQYLKNELKQTIEHLNDEDEDLFVEDITEKEDGD